MSFSQVHHQPFLVTELILYLHAITLLMSLDCYPITILLSKINLYSPPLKDTGPLN
jgi:hypothetical protein